MATAANAGQKRCLRHINHLLQPVEEDAKIFGDMRVKLEKNAWKIESLADPKRDVQTGIPDDYDSFVITARAAPDDLASLANYVYTHAQVSKVAFVFNSAEISRVSSVAKILRPHYHRAQGQISKVGPTSPSQEKIILSSYRH